MRTILVIATALILTVFSAASQARDTHSSIQADSVGQANKPVKPVPAAAQVNLNTATVEQLQALRGVGPATAARIVEYREKQGGFKKIEDLMNVRGIGEKTFLSLKPMIVVTPVKGLGW